MWQYVARKAQFIADTKSRDGARTITDVDEEMTISAAAASAIATGDPRIIERAGLFETIRSLETLRSAHHTQTAQATFDARVARDRTHAGEQIVAAVNAAAGQLKTGESVQVATYDALPVYARATRSLDGGWSFTLTIDQARELATHLDGPPATWSTTGLVTRLENLTRSVDDMRARLASEAAADEARIPLLEQAAATAFDQRADLDDARARLEEIDAQLQLDATGITASSHEAVISGSQLRQVIPGLDGKNRYDYYRGYAADQVLRTGDVIRGVAGAPTILHEVMDVTETDGVTVRPLDEDTEPISLPRGKIELVMRPASQLNRAQQWAIDHDLTLHHMGYFGGRPGETILLQRADGSIENGTLHARISEPKDETPGAVTLVPEGIDTADLTAADMRRVEYSREDRWYTANPLPTARTYDPDDGYVLPGDVLAGDVHLPTGLVVPAGTMSVLDPGGHTALAQHLLAPDGTYLPATDRAVTQAEGQFNRGPELTANDLAAIGLPVTMNVADLRRGDIVASRDLDPTAKIAHEIRILSVGGGGSRGEFTYAPVTGGPITTITRSLDAEITLHSRRAGAVTDFEVRQAAEPRVRQMRLRELEPGQGNIVALGHHPAESMWSTHRQLDTGTLTAARPASTNRPAEYTLTRTDGTERSLPDSTVLVYPDGMTPPVAIPRDARLTDRIRDAQASVPSAIHDPWPAPDGPLPTPPETPLVPDRSMEMPLR